MNKIYAYVHMMEDGGAKRDKITMGGVKDVQGTPSVGAHEFPSGKMARKWIVRGRSVLLYQLMSG